MINYSQCWEDAELVTEALDISSEDSVLSVTSGGCNTLALAVFNPKIIYSVDRCQTQNYLLELKLTAVQHLHTEELSGFMGYSANANRIKIYKKISCLLSKECRRYWDSNLDYIKTGIVNCGKFERYLSLFRKFVLPVIHNSKRINKLIDQKDKDAQLEFYRYTWNNRRWRFFFNVFFSKKIMSGRGRTKEMFSQNNNTAVSSKFFSRIEEGFKYGPLSGNFYLSYILLGEKNRLLPFYLKNNHLQSFNKITFHSQGILDFLQSRPEESISKFNLSDIFEPLNQLQTDRIFREILRTAKNGAMLIFWNNLVKRDIPDAMKNSFMRETGLEQKLINKNKVFFYDRFLIYKIVK